MKTIRDLELVLAEIKFLELKLESLKIEENRIREEIGDINYSNHPYLPR